VAINFSNIIQHYTNPPKHLYYYVFIFKFYPLINSFIDSDGRKLFKKSVYYDNNIFM